MIDVVYPMNAERDGPHAGKVIGYMCMTDFEFELGAALGGNEIFPSEADCERECRCIKGCGMVQVAVEFVRIVRLGDGT